MTVRVANDFKTETQQAYEQLAMDNKNLREKIRMLESQIEKLNKCKIPFIGFIYDFSSFLGLFFLEWNSLFFIFFIYFNNTCVF